MANYSPVGAENYKFKSAPLDYGDKTDIEMFKMLTGNIDKWNNSVKPGGINAGQSALPAYTQGMDVGKIWQDNLARWEEQQRQAELARQAATQRSYAPSGRGDGLTGYDNNMIKNKFFDEEQGKWYTEWEDGTTTSEDQPGSYIYDTSEPSPPNIFNERISDNSNSNSGLGGFLSKALTSAGAVLGGNELYQKYINNGLKPQAPQQSYVPAELDVKLGPQTNVIKNPTLNSNLEQLKNALRDIPGFRSNMQSTLSPEQNFRLVGDAYNVTPQDGMPGVKAEKLATPLTNKPQLDPTLLPPGTGKPPLVGSYDRGFIPVGSYANMSKINSPELSMANREYQRSLFTAPARNMGLAEVPSPLNVINSARNLANSIPAQSAPAAEQVQEATREISKRIVGNKTLQKALKLSGRALGAVDPVMTYEIYNSNGNSLNEKIYNWFNSQGLMQDRNGT